MNFSFLANYFLLLPNYLTMKNFKHYLLLLLTILVISACTKEDTNKIPIDKGLNVSLKQQFSNEGSFVTLECITKDTYSCSNHQLVYSLNIMNNEFYINFFNIDCNICGISEDKSSSADIALPLLSEGLYPIHFTINNTTETAYLSINAAVAKLNFNFSEASNKKIDIVNEEMLLIPNHSIWGEVYFYNDYTDEAHNMLEQFVAMGAEATTLAPGRYANCFDVLENNKIIFNDIIPEGDVSKIPFLYTYEGDTQNIINIIEDTINKNKLSPTSPAVYAWINDTKGVSILP